MRRIAIRDMNGNRRGERILERGHNGASSLKISLIIPTLDEAENLKFVLPAIPGIIDELVIVDGGSADSTLDVVRELRPDAKIIVETVPGKGTALRRGFEATTGDILVMMDADGSMDPLDIGTFVAALEAGADVAKGSRFLQGGGSADMTTLRRVGNRALTHAVRLTFGGRYSDLCYGFMAFWRHVLPSRALLTIGRERRRLSKARAERGVPRPAWHQLPAQITSEAAAAPAPVAEIFPNPPAPLINEA
jgi:glycosyltransferase involved in cell wall biosynthesis